MMRPPHLKILVAFSLPLYSKGFKVTLSRKSGISADIAINAPDVFKRLSQEEYHMLYLDEALPDIGIEVAIVTLRSLYPQLKIIIVTVSVNVENINTILRFQPHGIIHASTTGAEVYNAIDPAFNNTLYLCPSIGALFSQVINVIEKKPAPSFPDAHLTSIEQQVLQCKLKGDKNRVISQKLNKSYFTVRSHIKNINKKLIEAGHKDIVELCNALNK